MVRTSLAAAHPESEIAATNAWIRNDAILYGRLYVKAKGIVTPAHAVDNAP